MKRIEIIPAVLIICCLLAIASAVVILLFKACCLLNPKIVIISLAVIVAIYWIRKVLTSSIELWIVPNKNETCTKVKVFKNLSDMHYWLDDDRNSYLNWKFRFIRR